MNKILRLVICALPTFLLAHLNTKAQDINGTWTGNYQKHMLMTQPRQLVVELTVYNDSLVTGLSHLYYLGNKYEHYRVRGKFNKKDSTIYFKEDSTIAVYLGPKNSNCLGNYTMKLYYTDSTMVLYGKWKDNNRSLFHCPTTGVYLTKKLPPKIIPKPSQTDTVKSKIQVNQNSGSHIAITPALPDTVMKREQEVQKLLEYDVDEKDSVLITIYDNGEIDDDSVSVYFDGTPMLQKVRITDKPIQFYVNLNPKQPTHRMLMVAESIGTIPPCTALMIVKTRKNRYEMSLSSSFEKNAVLEFFFKE